MFSRRKNPSENFPAEWEENQPADDADFDSEEELEDEHEGRGLAFFVLAAVISIGILAGTLYGVRTVIQSNYLDQVTYTFGRDVSLLPERNFRPTPTEQTVRIFQTEDGQSLVPAMRRLRRVVTEPEKSRLILQELLSPSARSAGLYTPLPEGTETRGFYQIGKIGYLDLTESFLLPAVKTPQGERLAVYSLVNSLVLNDAGVEAVQLLIEGKPIETAWGWLDCSTPLGANLSIVN